jgi:hypothetical protein
MSTKAKRFLWLVSWIALVGALVGATLFAVAFVTDDVHVLSTYGLGSGPGAHTGYGSLAEVVFLALPAAGSYVVAIVGAIVLRAVYDDTSFLKRLARVTTGLLVLGGAIGLFELTIDHLETRERKRTTNAIAQGEAIAANHEELAAYVRSHGSNALLPGDASTPLHAAVDHEFSDLVSELVSQGATVSDDDLTVASRSGNLEILTLLLDHENGLPGLSALDAGYSVGNLSVLELLVSRGVHATPELVTLLNGQSFKLFPGEVNWTELQHRWQTEPSTPLVIARAISLHQGKPFPGDENDVLEVLAEVLAASDFCIDKNVALQTLAIDSWMKTTGLCSCNNCPYARPINWAILAATYSGAIPPLLKSKALAMFRVLAHSAANSPDDQKPTLRTAVSNQNVELLQVLEDEGLDIHLLDGELDENAFFLNDPAGARMKTHLIEKKIRWRN